MLSLRSASFPVLVLLLNVSALASAQHTTAPSPPTLGDEQALQDARAHFRLGVEYYRERNFRAALIEFRTAYAIQPSYKLLYNLAQASIELQEYERAVEYLARYLRDGGADVTPDAVRGANETIAWLESRMATIALSCDEAGAEIYLDQTLVGRAPLHQEVRLSVGRHTFKATKPGLPSVERFIEVAAGERRDVQLDFVLAPRAQAALPPPPPRSTAVAAKAGLLRSNSGLIWAAIITGSLAASAVTTSIMTAQAEGEYVEARNTVSTGNGLNTLRRDVQTKSLVTDILWSATAVSAAVSIIVLLSDAPEEDARPTAAGLSVDITPSQVLLRGRL